MLQWPDDLKPHFQFRDYSNADSEPLSVGRALELIKADGGDFSCNASDVLINDDLMFLPFRYVGCYGVLVERRTGKLWWLGSAVPPLDQVWAYYKGARSGETNDDRLCDLVIDKVYDLNGTITLFRRISNQSFVDELIPKLSNPPIILHNIDVLWNSHELRIAETKKLFSFRILT